MTIITGSAPKYTIQVPNGYHIIIQMSYSTVHNRDLDTHLNALTTKLPLHPNCSHFKLFYPNVSWFIYMVPSGSSEVVIKRMTSKPPCLQLYLISLLTDYQITSGSSEVVAPAAWEFAFGFALKKMKSWLG